MASCGSESGFINIRQLPIVHSAQCGDYFVVDTDTGTSIIDFCDIIIGENQVTFDDVLTSYRSNSGDWESTQSTVYSNSASWSGGVSKYTTGWATSHGSVTVAQGSTHNITHNLSTTDVTVNIWVSSSADGSNPQLLNGVSSSAGSERGALITNLDTNTAVLQLRRDGYLDVSTDGSTSSVVSFAGKYIKVVVIG